MVAITETLLRTHGIELTPREVEAFMVAAIERLGVAMERQEPSRDLCEAEVDVLEAGGWTLEPQSAANAPDPLFEGAASYWELLATGLTTQAAAERLGVHESRIRQRLKERSLYGIKQGAAWRLPAFQFVDTHEVVGWAKVLPALDEALHPVSVYRWFTSPSVDLVRGGLERGGISVSPRAWLLEGGDVDTVVALAADLSVT